MLFYSVTYLHFHSGKQKGPSFCIVDVLQNRSCPLILQYWVKLLHVLSFQRLHAELPLSLEELEKVFVTLDADGNGSLSLKEFTTGFSEFGKHVSCIELYSYSVLSTSIKKHFILTVHLMMHAGSQTISQIQQIYVADEEVFKLCL